MDVALFTHPVALDHDTGFGHPERPARIGAAITGVHRSGLDVTEIEAPTIERGDLERIHDAAYVDRVKAFCASGGGAFDPDTRVVPASWEASLRSAGGVVAATEYVAAAPVGERTAFVAMRPPGHHAERSVAMGFCLFNNVAVTAARLVAAGSRVAVIDWDVHHGNGTQHSFYDEPDVLYVSFHQAPFYPGTGAPDEHGLGEAAGTTINLAWPAGTEGATYRHAMATVVAPVLTQFAPDWVLFSAGYDAHERDPLAMMRLVADDYSALASAVVAAVPSARSVFVLEGGYDLDAITESVAASIAGLATPVQLDAPSAMTGPGGRVTAAVASRLRAWWELP